MTHGQETIHLEGDPKLLDPIARSVFGVSLEQITKAFASAE
jgi:hypothetical protein